MYRIKKGHQRNSIYINTSKSVISFGFGFDISICNNSDIIRDSYCKPFSFKFDLINFCGLNWRDLSDRSWFCVKDIEIFSTEIPIHNE